jgi:hypothetical protein
MKTRTKHKINAPLVVNHTEVKDPAPWPDPTPGMLKSVIFNRVWECIKTWDINVPEVYAGYSGATGNHVRAILDALSKPSEHEHESWAYYIRVSVPKAQTELRIHNLIEARCEIQRLINVFNLNIFSVAFLHSKRDDTLPQKMQSLYDCNLTFEESLAFFPCYKCPTPEMIEMVTKELEWLGLRVNQDFEEAASVTFVMIEREKEAVFKRNVLIKQFF